MPSPQSIDPAIARERSVELAERDLPVIEQLLESKGWQYLERRLREHQAIGHHALATDEGLTDLETRILRRVCKEIDHILALPGRDRLVHMRTLAENAKR